MRPAPPGTQIVEGFDPECFAELAAVEEGSFWFRSRNALLLWAIGRYAPAGWTDLLEVGCGTGFVLEAIAERYPAARLTGTELFAEGLDYARRRVPSASLQQMDALASPFHETFDVIGAFDVLEHITDDDGALIGIRKALRPGGVLLVTVPQHPALWGPSDVRAHHVRRYRARELEAKLVTAGLTIVRSTSFVSILLPALIASRLRPAGDSIGDQRLPSWLSWVFTKVMDGERRAIVAGVTFPIGGSRLVVAQKAHPSLLQRT